MIYTEILTERIFKMLRSKVEAYLTEQGHSITGSGLTSFTLDNKTGDFVATAERCILAKDSEPIFKHLDGVFIVTKTEIEAELEADAELKSKHLILLMSGKSSSIGYFVKDHVRDYEISF